jgi:2,4-dienoyl-CoA reductase-like NADH-dependent reductase (Old Yellow Enzyme family)/thioredoxin reductase
LTLISHVPCEVDLLPICYVFLVSLLWGLADVFFVKGMQKRRKGKEMSESKRQSKEEKRVQKGGLSRRQFLSGVGVAGLAAAGAGAGIAGCSPADGGASSGGGAVSGGGGATASDGELIGAAYLNPQDYDYRQNTTDFKTLFSPVKLGPVESSVRIIKSAAGSATYLKGPSDEMLEYYVNFAKGGVEFIIIEGVDWLAPVPGPFPGGVTVPKEEAIAFGKKLVEECGKYGASLIMQWGAFAPGALEELTVAQIQEIEDMGIVQAQWYQDMGFKGLELHMTGGGLANSLQSLFWNTRTDEYGAGSIENRARQSVNTIKKIKAAVGDDFGVGALIECVVENDNVTNNIGEAFMWADSDITLPYTKTKTIEEGIEIVKLLEEAGLDWVQCRIGITDYHPAQFASDLYFILNGLEGASSFGTQFDFSRHFQGEIIGNHSGAGMLIDVAKRYKEALNIPVGAVTYMDPAHAPDFFEAALADGKLDFYSMTRPLTVDPEYVNKLREGRRDEIAPCCRCLCCHIGSNESNRELGYCRVNALTQRVLSGVSGTPTTYELPPLSGSPKNVMVIGGGPGGLEAARVAAARGHKVTLYEKNGALGGKLDFASRVKGPHENLDDLKAYLEKQQEVNGVTVVLNKEVDAAFINAEAPDVVILAIGSLPGVVGVDGSNSVPVIDYDSFETADLGENVVVFGSNAQAFDAALWLTVHKKKVNLVTPRPNNELDQGQSQHAFRFMTSSLYTLGLKAWPESSIKSVGDGQITITSKIKNVDINIPADAIINAADVLPNKSLLDEVSVAETYAIGDCGDSYSIALAIQAGNDVGRTI